MYVVMVGLAVVGWGVSDLLPVVNDGVSEGVGVPDGLTSGRS